MFRRLLSLILIIAMLCVEIPAVLAESDAAMPIPEDMVAEDEILELEEGSEEADSEEELEEEGEMEYRSLKRGDSDTDDSADVVLLQQALIDVGYLRGSADGIYGSATEKAVAAFQRNNGLEETGVADVDTQVMLHTSDELVHFYDSDDPESVAFRVADQLEVWGFASGVPTGVVNQKTDDGVAEFNRYLRSYLAANPTPAPVASPTPEPTLSSGYGDAEIAIDIPIDPKEDEKIGDDIMAFVDGKYEFNTYQKTLSSGDEGVEVLRLQRRLYDLKYLAVAGSKFDAQTERALLYFQKKNGLPQNAVADETTQRLLFSEASIESEEFVNAYKFVIDVSDQRVYVYQWNGSNYSNMVGEMICSTGTKANPTPLGTFQAAGPTGTGLWYYFREFECYAKWATRIVGGILFHSVTYSKGKSMNRTALRKLGKRASHGCIRLKVEHAKWVYDNCIPGTTVVVQD